jgi:hypothetical protein
MRIAVLQGRESGFCEALRERLSAIDAFRVTELKFAGASLDQSWDCDLIVDRASRDLPAMRSLLRQALLDGVAIVGDPFRSGLTDRFFELTVLRRLGLSVPETILLPNKDYAQPLGEADFGDLAYPIAWAEFLERTGVPAWLKEARREAGRGAAQIHKVHTEEELLYRFDRAGTSTVMLQADVVWERYYRVFVFGASRSIVARQDAASGLLSDPVKDLAREELRAIGDLAKRATQALGHTNNAVEIAVDRGRLCIVDASQPDPQISRECMDEALFARLVEAMVREVRRRADELRAGISDSRLASLLGGGAPQPAKGRRGRGRSRAKGRAPARETKAREDRHRGGGAQQEGGAPA